MCCLLHTHERHREYAKRHYEQCLSEPDRRNQPGEPHLVGIHAKERVHWRDESNWQEHEKRCQSNYRVNGERGRDDGANGGLIVTPACIGNRVDESVLKAKVRQPSGRDDAEHCDVQPVVTRVHFPRQERDTGCAHESPEGTFSAPRVNRESRQPKALARKCSRTSTHNEPWPW